MTAGWQHGRIMSYSAAIGMGCAARLVRGDAFFHQRAEMPDQALDRPRRRVAQRADRVAFDLPRHLLQRIDFVRRRAAFDHAGHDPPHPAGAFAARRALAAAFVHVEFRQPGDRLDHVGGFVHHDDRRGAEPAAHRAQTVEIHQHVVADRFRDQRHRGAARNDRQQVVPAAAHAAGIFVDQFPQRNAEFFLDIAGLVHMAGDAEHFLPRVVLPPEAGEPRRAAAQDRRRHRDAFDVVHRGRAAVQPDAGRERRLHPRHALLALEAFDQRRFLAADIGAGAAMQEHIVIVTGPAGVLADQSGLVSLIDRLLQ